MLSGKLPTQRKCNLNARLLAVGAGARQDFLSTCFAQRPVLGVVG